LLTLTCYCYVCLQGLPASGNLCSRCWREQQGNERKVAASTSAVDKRTDSKTQNDKSKIQYTCQIAKSSLSSSSSDDERKTSSVEVNDAIAKVHTPICGNIESGNVKDVVMDNSKMKSVRTDVSSRPKKKVVKKKAKKSFKSMMSGIMKRGNLKERNLQDEKDALKKVTGGGQFLKVDKI